VVRPDAGDRLRHRLPDLEPVPAEHGDGPAFGRQQPLTVIQADDVDADLRSLAEQLADPRDRTQSA
jgi:hypothetical protein